MAWIREKYRTPRATYGDSPSLEIGYLLRGYSSEAAAYAALGAELLALTVMADGSIVQFSSADLERKTDDSWDATAIYNQKTQDDENDAGRYAFSTGGGTQHITQSLETISKTAAANQVATDYKGAIGVSDEGEVEGLDIKWPAFEFSETHILTEAQCDGAYKLAVFRLTSRMNQGSFKGLAAGECLFAGAQGSTRDDGKWEITYNFVGQPNETNIVIGDITVASKKGWDYLWIAYAWDVDDEGKKRRKIPIQANVERVYYEGDFSVLGIGT